MKIRINGDEMHVEKEITVAELVRRLKLDDRPVAVEVNRTVVPKSRHDSIRIRGGDSIEIVTFVGGG